MRHLAAQRGLPHGDQAAARPRTKSRWGGSANSGVLCWEGAGAKLASGRGGFGSGRTAPVLLCGLGQRAMGSAKLCSPRPACPPPRRRGSRRCAEARRGTFEATFQTYGTAGVNKGMSGHLEGGRTGGERLPKIWQRALRPSVGPLQSAHRCLKSSPAVLTSPT